MVCTQAMLSKMAAVLKHWTESSTLILVTARQQGQNVEPYFANSSAAKADSLKGTNLEILLLKRSAKSKFMPNVYVFPGGVASDVDFSADWIQVFDLLGKDHRQNLFDFVQRGGQGAPMFSRLRDQRFSHIPSEIAFRICAIRETFEESGVLIARKIEKALDFRPSLWDRESWASYCQDTAIIDEWRYRVNKDPGEFLRMCQELKMVPDVWSLYEWSNWLTPREFKLRFDTAFFIACVKGKPTIAEDEGETVHSQWASPRSTLREYSRGRVGIAPPQIYELGRLMQFNTVPDLLKFAWHRGQHRVERWMPVRMSASDSPFSVLPGDSLYPDDVNPEGPPTTNHLNQTLAELEKSHPNKHHIQFGPDMRHSDGRIHFRVVCNVALQGEHVSPSSIDDKFPESENPTSKM